MLKRKRFHKLSFLTEVTFIEKKQNLNSQHFLLTPSITNVVLFPCVTFFPICKNNQILRILGTASATYTTFRFEVVSWFYSAEYPGVYLGPSQHVRWSFIVKIFNGF